MCPCAALGIDSEMTRPARLAVLVGLMQQNYPMKLAETLQKGCDTPWHLVETLHEKALTVRQAADMQPDLADRVLMSPAAAYELNRRLLLEMLEFHIGDAGGEPTRPTISKLPFLCELRDGVHDCVTVCISACRFP